MPTERERIMAKIGHIRDGVEFLSEIDGILDDFLREDPENIGGADIFDYKRKKQTYILWHVAKYMNTEAFSADVWRWWRKHTSLVVTFGRRVLEETMSEKFEKELNVLFREVVFDPDKTVFGENNIFEELLRQKRVGFSESDRKILWDRIRKQGENLKGNSARWILDDPNSTKEEFLEIAKSDPGALQWSEVFFYKGSRDRSGDAINWLIDNIDPDVDKTITIHIIRSPYTSEAMMRRFIGRIKNPEAFGEDIAARPEISWARVGVRLLLLKHSDGYEDIGFKKERWPDILIGLNEKDDLIKVMLVHKNRSIREMAIRALGASRRDGLGR